MVRDMICQELLYRQPAIISTEQDTDYTIYQRSPYGGQTNQGNQATASVADIRYREWGSGAHGLTLFGDLNTEIHDHDRAKQATYA